MSVCDFMQLFSMYQSCVYISKHLGSYLMVVKFLRDFDILRPSMDR